MHLLATACAMFTALTAVQALPKLIPKQIHEGNAIVSPRHNIKGFCFSVNSRTYNCFFLDLEIFWEKESRQIEVKELKSSQGLIKNKTKGLR